MPQLFKFMEEGIIDLNGLSFGGYKRHALGQILLDHFHREGDGVIVFILQLRTADAGGRQVRG